jgi:hypothetical protein
MRNGLLTLAILLTLFLSTQIVLSNQNTAQAEATSTPKAELKPDNATAKKEETSDSKSIKDYLRSVDETLDASLAATLAGLALAAAAFLLPLEQKKLDEIKTSHSLTFAEAQQLSSSRKWQDRLAAIKKLDDLKTQITSAEDEARLKEFDQIDKAVKILVWSFFFFTAALIDSIIADPLSDLTGELDKKTLAELAVSGGGTIAGIACMIRGALLIRGIVSPGKLMNEQSPDKKGGTAESAEKKEL